jgi:hypothetical protein
VWTALGGGEMSRNRGRAFWRNGDGFSVAIDSEKNVWYDFRDSRGGGLLDLVQVVRGCSRASALRWLSVHSDLASDSLVPRKELARAGAAVFAQRLSDFARGLSLVTSRRLTLAGWLRLDPETLAHWHQQAYLLNVATPKEIFQLWSACPQERDLVERVGKKDRLHAETITTVVVEMLSATTTRVAA